MKLTTTRLSGVEIVIGGTIYIFCVCAIGFDFGYNAMKSECTAIIAAGLPPPPPIDWLTAEEGER